jgi:hypothetical protein
MFSHKHGFLLAAATVLMMANAASLQHRRQSSSTSSSAFTDPTASGGSMLSRISPSSSLGEPLNVIISAQSDSAVLTAEGVAEYFESLYFSPGDCAGISEGSAQEANLGDGNGYVNQTNVLRFNYYGGDEGTCLESLFGGNHLRYWVQNGSSADTKAIFVAASVEKNATYNHDIVDNGYDLGRDWLTGNATNSTGTTSPSGTRYSASVSQVSLLQSISADQINHGISIDGQVNVLTVNVTGSGGTQGSSTSTSGSMVHTPHIYLLGTLLTLCLGMYSVV